MRDTFLVSPESEPRYPSVLLTVRALIDSHESLLGHLEPYQFPYLVGQHGYRYR